MKEFNLNNEIQFKISGRRGLEIYKNDYYKTFEFLPKDLQLSKINGWDEIQRKFDNKEYFSMQCWEFIRVFGNSFYMGMPDTVETAILIKEEDLTNYERT